MNKDNCKISVEIIKIKNKINRKRIHKLIREDADLKLALFIFL